MSLIHNGGRTWRRFVEFVTPEPTESKFLSEGKLTRDEFKQAGNKLCEDYPSYWKWQGDENEPKLYLQREDVRCDWRANSLGPPIVEQEDGWAVMQNDGSDDDSDAVPDPAQNPMHGPGGGEASVAKDPQRTYSLNIVWSKYYMSPTFWVKGFDADGVALSKEQMFEDIASQFVEKTVFHDPHPHKPEDDFWLSIHPCRHTEVMKSRLDEMQERNNGIVPRVDLALYVFLEFISSVVPTLQYDFADVEQ